MSRFTVTIELLAFPKGNVTQTIEEHYTSWNTADKAFEAWQNLAKQTGSKVVHVWLKEHKEESIRKEAHKSSSDSKQSEGTNVMGIPYALSIHSSCAR